eukprot:m.149225 g.149225  ORF g.149225 m.149225 type:complete len:176 (-) comp17340_c0_seq2:625-1152(-)
MKRKRSLNLEIRSAARQLGIFGPGLELDQEAKAQKTAELEALVAEKNRTKTFHQRKVLRRALKESRDREAARISRKIKQANTPTSDDEDKEAAVQPGDQVASLESLRTIIKGLSPDTLLSFVTEESDKSDIPEQARDSLARVLNATKVKVRRVARWQLPLLVSDQSGQSAEDGAW